MPRTYCEGEIFHYRGEPLTLRLIPTDDATLLEAERKVGVDGRNAWLLLREMPPEERQRHLHYWYTAETERIVGALIPKWSKALGVRPRSARVKFAKTRWGSCSSNRGIFFNSRIAMLSDDVAEYLVVHELCHLKEMNHSPAFWEEVERALPNARELRRKLRREERYTLL